MTKLSISSVAKTLGVTTNRVYQFIAKDRLHAERDDFSGQLFITSEELARFTSIRRKAGAPKGGKATAKKYPKPTDKQRAARRANAAKALKARMDKRKTNPITNITDHDYWANLPEIDVD